MENHKFDLLQFSRKTEIIVNFDDKEKLTTALDEQNFKFVSETMDSEFKVITKYRLGRTALSFLKGRIVPRVKYKPKSTIEPIYDRSVIVGFSGCLATHFEWKYKQLN